MKTEDFVELCKKGEWEIANAYVNELWEEGKDIQAERLRRLFLQAQYNAEELIEFVPFTHEEPPVLEACWFEGTPKQYEEAEFAGMNQHEAQYQAYKAQV